MNIERITELDFSDRDNEVTFLEASEALFHMFKEYVSRKQSIKGRYRKSRVLSNL